MCVLGMSDKDDKHGKGLRHFSGKVRQKVETKRVTSYNEVADELVGGTTSNSSCACFLGYSLSTRICC